MSDVVSSKKKIQQESVQASAAISSSLGFILGGSINYLIDATDQNASDISSSAAALGVRIDNVRLKHQAFSSSGSWVAPANVDRVLLLGAGGGGGGGGGSSGVNEGAWGGFGASLTIATVDVTPTASHAVTIGAGGPGGSTGPATAGGDGGNTTFVGASQTITFYGAPGGAPGGPTATSSLDPLRALNPGFAFVPGGAAASAGKPSPYAAGTAAISANIAAGGSGGSGIQSGGAGGLSSVGATGGISGGGGGGGGTNAGGAGGAGYLIVLWVDE